MTKQDLKMLTIERKEAIRDRLFKYDLSVGEGKLLEEEVFNILDQELSNHTQRVIGEHNARILNHFQAQGKPDMPIIAYDERVCLIPAITLATQETLQTNPTKDNENRN